MLPRRSLLNPQDAFANLTAAIVHDGWLPIGMRSTQRFDQASSKSIFRQGRLEAVFVLKLFALLRGQIGLQENFTRIILLPEKNVLSSDQNQDSEQSSAGSPHAMARRHGRPAPGRFCFHRR